MPTRITILLLVIVAILLFLAPAMHTQAYSKSIVIVDDDGKDCPNADLVGEDAIQKAISTGLVKPNGTIIACSGVYTGFSNRIRDFYGRVKVTPVTIIGRGNVVIVYGFSTSIEDVVLENVTIFLSSVIDSVTTLRLMGRVTIVNTTIEFFGFDWSYSGVFIEDNSRVRISSSRILVLSPTISNPIIRSINASYIEISFSNISGGIDLRARNILFYNNTKDSLGSYDRFSIKCFASLLGWFICIINKPHPTATLIGDHVEAYYNVFEGSVYIKSNNANITRNMFVRRAGDPAHDYEIYNYNPVDPFGDVFNAGLDFVLVDGNGVIEYNVFKYAGEKRTYSRYNISYWGALRILGVYTVRRNLFYSNRIALIVNSTSLVYDNLFINNGIQAISTPLINLNIDPPIESTNIIGGPYLGGNYWSDYQGYDTDGDGLGDQPYINSYGALDLHPLVLPSNLTECPPYMGATDIGNTGNQYLFPLVIVVTGLSLVLLHKDRRRKGLANVLGVITGVVAAIGLIILVVLIVYNPSVAALSKTASPIVTIGEPYVTGNSLNIVLYNPGPTSVCVEKVLVNGKRISLLSSVDDENALLRLEKAVLKDNVTLLEKALKEYLLSGRMIPPKNSRKFTGPVEHVNGLVNVTVIANNGVWRFYANANS